MNGEGSSQGAGHCPVTALRSKKMAHDFAETSLLKCFAEKKGVACQATGYANCPGDCNRVRIKEGIPFLQGYAL